MSSNNSSPAKTFLTLAALGGVSYYIYQKHQQHKLENPECHTSDGSSNYPVPSTPPPSFHYFSHVATKSAAPQGFIANLPNQPFPAFNWHAPFSESVHF
jgi:hypothetical protein